MLVQNYPDENPCRPIMARFDPVHGRLSVHLDPNDYGYAAVPVSYSGRVFQPKSELHITIISQDARLIVDFLARHPDYISDWDDLVQSNDWSYRKLAEWYWAARSATVETIIQRVEVPMLESFFSGASRLIGQGLTLPPTHVTLYMRGTELGIGIPDAAAWQERVRARVWAHELTPAVGES